MRHRILDTFTGPFALIEHDNGTLKTTWLHAQVRSELRRSTLSPRLMPELAGRLRRFFEGDTEVDFSDVPMPAGPPFFRQCWIACQAIPRGETRSYGELAALAGSTPAASRAAGQAMRNNPLPIITPCHRVIGSSGKLHGFSGSCDAAGEEVAVKRLLLEMEQGTRRTFTREPTRRGASKRSA